MEILAFLNQIGGSAKTTTAVNLGSALAEKKQKVLLIDIDPQGSASSWLGFRNPSKGLFTLFTVCKTGVDGLHIIVSSPWLVSADQSQAKRIHPSSIYCRKV